MPVPVLTPEQVEICKWLETSEAHYQSTCKEAQIFLRQSFGDARLQTFCLRFIDGELDPIPPPRWWTQAGDYAFTFGQWVADVGDGPRRTIGIVVLRETELEALLIPQGGNSPVPAEPALQASYSPAPAGNTLPPPDPAQGLSITDGPPSVRRPSYSPSALAGWFALREAAWPKDAPYPSEAEDLKAARNYFEGQIPRGEFRKIRHSKTPENWRKPGPRRAPG
jgi:hypothetical protein